MILKYLAGPVIGAAIGYCTNYIAVKMLFYPKKEVKVFGKRLPFTPGAIPKGKPRLAKAIGEIVGKTLITKDDIEEKLLTDEIGLQISDLIIPELSCSIKELAVHIGYDSEENDGKLKEKLALLLSNEIIDAISKVDISELIASKGGAIVKEKVQGTMLQMFLTDELIQSVTTPIGTELQTMISEHGTDYVYPMMLQKLDELEEKSISGILSSIDVNKSDIKNIISHIFTKVMEPCIGKIVDSLDLASIAEEKINLMTIDELEDMVISVMKKELNTIVNLGALIGFLLGLLNIFI